MTFSRYTVEIDGRTYEGRYSRTPKHGIDLLHVRGPLEWKRPMHHTLDLSEWSWVTVPDSPAVQTGTRRGPEFVQAGWTMAHEWELEQVAPR